MAKPDWCTSWPDRWKHIDYSECCHQHDIDYALIDEMPGNIFEKAKARKKADYRLMSCVRDSGLPLMGLIMMFGVRMFGWLFAYKPKGEAQDISDINKNINGGV